MGGEVNPQSAHFAIVDAVNFGNKMHVPDSRDHNIGTTLRMLGRNTAANTTA